MNSAVRNVSGIKCALITVCWLAMSALLVAAEAERKTIVVLGDSIAAGYGVEAGESFPDVLQKRLAEKKLPWEIVNAGVSGDTTASGVRRMPWLLKRRVDVLLIELGGNDGLRGLAPEDTRTNLEKIIALAREKYPDVKIILAGMQMPSSMGAEYTKIRGAGERHCGRRARHHRPGSIDRKGLGCSSQAGRCAGARHTVR